MTNLHFGIKTKFLTVSLTIITLCLMIVIGTNVSLSSADARINYLENVQKQIEIVEYTISTFYNQIDQNLDMLATHPLIQEADDTIINLQNTTTENQLRHYDAGGIEQKIFELFNHYALTHQEVQYVYLATSSGSYINWPEVVMPAGYDPTQTDWYQAALAGNGSLVRTEPYQATSGAMVTSNMKAIYKPSGALLGVVGIDIDSHNLTELLSSLRLGNTGFFMLTHTNGTILADGHNEGNNFKKIDELNLENGELLLSLNGESFKTKINNEPYSAFTKKLHNEPWIITSFVSDSELFGNVRQFTLFFILLGVVSLILMGIAIIYCVHRITTPVKASPTHLQSLGNDDFS